MEISIRIVTADDYENIYALWCSAEETKRALNPVDDSRRAIIHHLCVHPAYRRQGIAGRLVNDALRRFNDEKAGPDNHVLLNIVEYDEGKNVIAGILGGTYWGWMHIDVLWVDEKYRRHGLGPKLLESAESEEKKRGCHFMPSGSIF